MVSLYEPIPIHDENLSSNSESECDDEDFQKLLSPSEPCDEIEGNDSSSSSATEKSATKKKVVIDRKDQLLPWTICRSKDLAHL